METFKTVTCTVRRLLKTEIDEEDRNKNFFIPPYQRVYAWTEEQVLKLIEDIFEQSNFKEKEKFPPYFIGGIVLSQQSMLGEERSETSLEVIDGQQRLTTLVLILSTLVQVLKFQNRHFSDNESISVHLINDMKKLIKVENLNINTMVVEEKFVLERSDSIKKDFEIVVDTLLSEKIIEESQLSKKLSNNAYAKNLVELVFVILNRIEMFEDRELLDFTNQLLNNTWLVVTKTISVETGFFIFEKLNDSGIALEPQDLLKNYLFRTSTDREYDELTSKWQIFLTKVESINTSKAKILPRDFLEQYLILNGSIKQSSDKRKVFKKLKEMDSNSFEKSMHLLDDLIEIANEYYFLKRYTNISQYLNAMNFKIGYLIVLSFFKRYGKAYLEHETKILAIVVRLGFVYLITGQSKVLSGLVSNICKEIMSEGENIEDTLIGVNSFVNASLIKKEDDLDEVISNTNLWRKKPLTRLLFSLVEFHLSGIRLPMYFNLFQVMPQSYSEDCEFEGINEDNYIKYANHIGNLLIDLDGKKFDDEICFNIQSTLSENIEVNRLTRRFLIGVKSPTSIEDSDLIWGKATIIERSQNFSKAAKHILIKNNFNLEFFKNPDQ